MSSYSPNEEPIGEALAATFLPALTPLAFELADVSDDGVQFDGAKVRFEARYVPRDGELAVYVIPHESGERLQLLLYLRAIRSDAATELGPAVAESPQAALREARIYAAALPEVASLLAGDALELERARSLRWWDAPID